MSHFGVLCPDLSGHLNPMMALARELERSGHRVTFYSRLICRPKLEAAGFRVRPFDERDAPPQVTKDEADHLARLNGLAALRFTVDLIRRRTAACLRDVPGMAREDRVDALLVDEVSWEGATIAEELDVSFVTVSNALVIYPEDGVPPFPFTWGYGTSRLARWRNRLAYRFLTRVAQPMLAAVNEYRARIGKRPYTGRTESVSPLLMISQEPAEFEFPRERLPEQFRFVGPLVDRSVREPVDFPFDRLATDRLLVYASMGTMQNGQAEIFHAIAAACEGMPVQLVISLGGGSDPSVFASLPGNPLVVPFAPQLELLRRTKLCVTHAGLNTTLESLSEGVPMVAIPITNDQPGVAARIRWTGCGEFVTRRRLNPARLRAMIERVLSTPSYAENARRLQAAIAKYGGAAGAAALVAAAVSSAAGGKERRHAVGVPLY